jgi:DNA-binding CsgD family transcriptional regulator
MASSSVASEADCPRRPREFVLGKPLDLCIFESYDGLVPCRFASTRGTRRASRRAPGSREARASSVRSPTAIVVAADRRERSRFLQDLLARRAEHEVRRGDWEGARRSASASVEAGRETGGRSPYGLYVLAALEAAQGRELECRRHVASFVSFGGDLPEWGRYADSVLGLLELGLGRVEAAIAHLEPLASDPRGRAPPLFAWAPNLIEGYVRGGFLPEARTACSRLVGAVERGHWVLGPAIAERCRALVASPDACEAAFGRALAWHGYSRNPFERARTELCFGERLRRRRRRRQARRWLASALAAFEQLDAVPWANRAAAEFRAGSDRSSGSRAAAGSLLTPAESHVAVLVANGYTNRETAASLFVTTKTVEFHLGQVYRKLGIRSRAELARVWVDQPRLDARSST